MKGLNWSYNTSLKRTVLQTASHNLGHLNLIMQNGSKLSLDANRFTSSIPAKEKHSHARYETAHTFPNSSFGQPLQDARLQLCQEIPKV